MEAGLAAFGERLDALLKIGGQTAVGQSLPLRVQLGGDGGVLDARSGQIADGDLVAVGAYLHDRFAQPILLVGHSLGGAAVLAAADEIGVERIAAIATIAAPADVPHVLERIDGDLAASRKDGAGAATIAPVTYVQMLVATTLGYVMFGDVPDLATFAGAGIIIGAGLLLWSRTAARAPSNEPSGLTGPK